MRYSDVATVDDRPRGLRTGAEDGVRCATDAEVVGGGVLEERLRFGAIHGQRLLAVHVLAGFHRGLVHRRVRGRDGQVEDDVHVVRGVQLRRRERADAGALLGDRLGPTPFAHRLVRGRNVAEKLAIAIGFFLDSMEGLPGEPDMAGMLVMQWSRAEAEAWEADLRARTADGDYFFSVNRYLFLARKS